MTMTVLVSEDANQRRRVEFLRARGLVSFGATSLSDFLGRPRHGAAHREEPAGVLALLPVEPVVDGERAPVEVLVLLHHIDVVER
jgi:hypothetical protein